MNNAPTQNTSGLYKEPGRERTILADAVAERFAASGVAVTKSGRYVDLDRVQHAQPAARL